MEFKIPQLNEASARVTTEGNSKHPLISLPRQPPNPPSPTATNDLHFSSDPPLSSIDHCTSIKQLKQVHPQMLRTGLLFDPYSASKLITVCAISSFSSLDYARQMFNQIPQPNLYSWNTLIHAYASSTDPTESMLVFLEMLYRCMESSNFLLMMRLGGFSLQCLVMTLLHGMSSFRLMNKVASKKGRARNLMSEPVLNWEQLILVAGYMFTQRSRV